MTAQEALSEVEAVVADDGEADDVLRRVVRALHARGGYRWAGILFVEGDALVLGPEAGEPRPGERTQVPVEYRGGRVAELAVDGAAPRDTPLLERVAALISPYCLVGWDTGGEIWAP